MSLFGQLDAANIPSDPYFIEKGEYECEVVKAEYSKNRDGERQLHIVYKITDNFSEYEGKQAHQYFVLVDSEMTQEKFDLLPADEKKKIRGRNSAIKRTLCGVEGRDNQKGLEIDPEELNDPNWNPEVLVGKQCMVTISNFGDHNTGVNVKWVNAL